MDFYPWQTQQIDTLLAQMGTGKLPHAILLTGAQGIGKTDFALAFVQRLFCQQALGVKACGQCEACHMLEVETHPDIKRIGPPEGKQNIVVDQIRDLIEYVSLTPHSSTKKVAVIEQADLLNVNAANSLLKTLEEPPESSMLILVTHRPDRLLPTIRSRCQQMLFATPDYAQAKEWLLPQLKNKADVEALLALSAGAPLKALTYAEDKVLEKRKNLFAEVEQLVTGKKSPVDVAKSWYKNDFDLVINCLTSWMIDMIRLKADQRKSVINNPDIRELLDKFARNSGLRNMMDFYQKLTKTGQLTKSNINPQMILEDVFIEWKKLCHQGR